MMNDNLGQSKWWKWLTVVFVALAALLGFKSCQTDNTKAVVKDTSAQLKQNQTTTTETSVLEVKEEVKETSGLGNLSWLRTATELSLNGTVQNEGIKSAIVGAFSDLADGLKVVDNLVVDAKSAKFSFDNFVGLVNVFKSFPEVNGTFADTLFNLVGNVESEAAKDSLVNQIKGILGGLFTVDAKGVNIVPVVEPVPEEEPATTEDSTPVEEAKPTEEPVTADEAKPVEEVSVQEATPEEEPTATEESVPAEEVKSVEEVTPVQEPTAIAELASTETSVTTEDVAVEEAVSTETSVPVENMAEATEVASSEDVASVEELVPEQEMQEVTPSEEAAPAEAAVTEEAAPTQVAVSTEEPEAEEIADMSLEKLDLNIVFNTGSAEIKQRYNRRLNAFAHYLIETQRSGEIAGHTDSVGDAEANQRLSEERANAVRDYLIAQGVPADQLVAVGYGQESPIADNGTEEGRAQNRRIEFNLRQ